MRIQRLVLMLLLCLCARNADSAMCTKHHYFTFDGGKVYCSIVNDKDKTIQIVNRAPTCGSDWVLTVMARVEHELNSSVITLPSRVEVRYYDGYTDKPVGTYTLTDIGSNAFEGCGNLQRITLPHTVKNIGSGAFRNCGSLQSVNIPATVENVNLDAFDGCNNLRELIVGNGVPNQGLKYFSFDGILCRDSEIIYCPRSFSKATLDIPTEVKRIANNVFADKQQLMALHFQSAVKIGVSSFKNCQSLQEIILSEGISEIPESAFENCTALETIKIPSSVTTIGKRAFFGCMLLESVDLSDGLEEIGCSAFESCISLKAVTIPCTIRSIIDNAFKGCSDLQSVTFAENTTDLRYLWNGAFSFCSSLKEIILPAGLEKIDVKVFLGCSSLERVVVNEELKTIDRYAFMGCSNLSSINIPEQTKIYEETFIDCPKLIL